MSGLHMLRKNMIGSFVCGNEYERIPLPKKYSRFSYPPVLGIMRSDTRLYRVTGFGKLMTMLTDTPFGMQLLTCSFMPYEGNSVPYLLTDIMVTKKKQLIFIEYYDCTAERKPQPLLEGICEKYSRVTDYAEKPAWYVGERTAYSLIKSLGADEDITLAGIASDSVRAYRKAAFSAERKNENLPGLLKFRERMISEGNPSSAVLKGVFGEKGAADFFRACVMPDR